MPFCACRERRRRPFRATEEGKILLWEEKYSAFLFRWIGREESSFSPSLCVRGASCACCPFLPVCFGLRQQLKHGDEDVVIGRRLLFLLLLFPPSPLLLHRGRGRRRLLFSTPKEEAKNENIFGVFPATARRRRRNRRRFVWSIPPIIKAVTFAATVGGGTIW